MHGPLTQLAAELWQIEADVPQLPIGRRMVICRRKDGDLLIHNAILCDPATMAQLEGLGPVRWLVVPGGYHRMDLAAWTARYPNCSVIANAAATARIRERGRVDGGPERIPADDHVEYVPLDGVPTEGVLIVRSPRAIDRSPVSVARVGDSLARGSPGSGAPSGMTLVFNDVVQNHARLPGMVVRVLGLLGSTGGPKVTGIARRFIVEDKRRCAEHLRRLATPDVHLIIPGHGQLIHDRPAEVLRSIADGLSPPVVSSGR